MKQILKGGDEFDAVYSRDIYHWKSGQLKKIKRRMNKRARQDGRAEVRREL
jgi:hypothetical protein